MTLTDFLLARLADGEELCVFAQGGTYNVERLDGRDDQREADAQRMMDYVRRFHPEWMMQDIAAKRRIVTAAQRWRERARRALDAGNINLSADFADRAQLLEDEVLAPLAAPYADHPDYRQAWKP